MPYKPREVASKLTAKFGFEPAPKSNPDHAYYSLKVPGVPVISTHFSHGNKEIPRAIEQKICQQLRVRNEFFHGMIDCSNSRDDYVEQLKTDPYPPFPDYMQRRLK
jgi:hypothetical protein